MSNSFRSRSRLRFATLACAAVFLLVSCERHGAPMAPAAIANAPAAAEPFVAPQDVFEHDARAIVGITYPTGLDRYPALAKLLVAHARARRAALEAALVQTPHPAIPFELTLRFSTAADSPRIFAVTTDEELYTGGSTSRSAREVFLWLPAQNRLLPPDEMIPDPAAWSRLHARIDRMQREESASLTAPASQRGMQHIFVPRLDSAGRIAGLRFRADNGDEIEVPGEALKPLVAPAYAAWFEGAPVTAGDTPVAQAKL